MIYNFPTFSSRFIGQALKQINLWDLDNKTFYGRNKLDRLSLSVTSVMFVGQGWSLHTPLKNSTVLYRQVAFLDKSRSSS